MTPDYELQEKNANILEAHRMRELESIDTQELVHYNLWEHFRQERIKAKERKAKNGYPHIRA